MPGIPIPELVLLNRSRDSRFYFPFSTPQNHKSSQNHHHFQKVPFLQSGSNRSPRLKVSLRLGVHSRAIIQSRPSFLIQLVCFVFYQCSYTTLSLRVRSRLIFSLLGF